jgi:hypothetical protein
MLTALSPNAKIPKTTPAGSSQTARPKLPDAVSVLGIGIGIGPFNLGLAALAEPLKPGLGICRPIAALCVAPGHVATRVPSANPAFCGPCNLRRSHQPF